MSEAADALLDVGVSVPLLSIKIPGRKRPIALRMVMRRPTLGGQMRLARKFLELGFTYEEIEAFDATEETAFMATRGRCLSEMVALCLLRGYWSGRLLYRPLAAWIRWRVETRIIRGVLMQYISLLGTQSFTTFIKYLDATHPMKPSHTARGS